MISTVRFDQSVPRKPAASPFSAAFEIRGSDGYERCGDAIALHDLSDGGLALAVVDVAGHGSACAPLSYYLSKHLIALLALGFSPATAARLADRDLRLERGRGGPPFATAFVARIDGEGHMLYASAGHETAMFVGANGAPRAIGVNGPALGFLDAPEFAERSTCFRDAERLVVVTDGVTESRDAELRMFGSDGVARCAADAPGARRAARAILDAATRHAPDGLRDDACALVADFTPPIEEFRSCVLS